MKNIQDRDFVESFRPVMPYVWKNNPTNMVINCRYKHGNETIYERGSDFYFAGAVPIDFDFDFGVGMCVSRELCSFDMMSLVKKNKYKLGIVFNLDPHYKSGSHWTSLFSDFKTGGIYYFDSYASKPPKEVMILMDRIKKQGNDLLRSGVLNIDDISEDCTVKAKHKKLSQRKIRVSNPQDFFM